jgi:hypothetical protein
MGGIGWLVVTKYPLHEDGRVHECVVHDVLVVCVCSRRELDISGLEVWAVVLGLPLGVDFEALCRVSSGDGARGGGLT